MHEPLELREGNCNILIVQHHNKGRSLPRQVLRCISCKKLYEGVPQSRFCGRSCQRAHEKKRVGQVRDIWRDNLAQIDQQSPQVIHLQTTLLRLAPERAIGCILEYWVEGHGYHTFPVFPLQKRRGTQGATAGAPTPATPPAAASPASKGEAARSHRRRTWDGSLSDRPFFLLRPFEIPSVPVPGMYRVRFVGDAPPHLVINSPELFVTIPFSVHCPGSPIPFSP